MSLRAAIIKYAKDKCQAKIDFPWKNFPNYAVLRHQGSDKWFALLMNVPREKLSLKGDGDIDVVNLKCRPELVGSLRIKDGFLPAYHMNKEHWVTVLLDNTVPEDLIYELIDDSYTLTAKN